MIKFWTRLSARERTAIFVAAGLLLFFSMLELGIRPYMARMHRLDRQTRQLRADYLDMQELRQELDRLRAQRAEQTQRFQMRSKDFSLFAFLDGLARDAGLKERVAYMKPSTAKVEGAPYRLITVEVKLQALSLAQLTDFLYRIETSEKALAVRRMAVEKTSAGRGFVDVVLQVETVEQL